MVVALLVRRLGFGMHLAGLPPNCGSLISFSLHKAGLQLRSDFQI